MIKETTEAIKKVQSNYYKPTPKKWRKLGDSLLAISTFVATYAIADEIKWLGISAMIVGAAGKFLTNFFAEEQ